MKIDANQKIIRNLVIVLCSLLESSCSTDLVVEKSGKTEDERK